MKIPFSKYQGTGNDFILIDNRTSFLTFYKELVKMLCDRHFGIGADGLILLQNHPDNDFEMVYFNSDGNESTMCGNGGRCITAFAKRLGIIDKEATFSAIDGEHCSIILDETNQMMNVKLKMNDVSDIELNEQYIFMNTGSPHYVELVDDIDTMNVFEKGKAIRNNDRFKAQGTNVNFIQTKDNELFVRTYERGVEDETLSCGTGVTAAAIASSIWKLNEANDHCLTNTLGGKMKVHFERNGTSYCNVWLEGAATFVFEGTIDL
ncbi:MAG: diaminopimelate epimerase [Bacteroidota bacterium]